MAPGESTPDWLRTKREDVAPTAERSGDGDAPPLRIPQVIIAGLVLIFSAATVSVFQDHPERLVLGIVPTGAAIAILVMITDRAYSLIDKSVYLAAAVAVNVYYTMAVGVSDSWSYLSLASLVLFSGVIGLSILDSDVREMSKIRRITVFAVVLVLFLLSNLSMTMSLDGGLRYLRIWLDAAYIPLAALLVFALAFVAAYPRSVQTMPADKWV